jgi:hypothetical protein
MSLFMHTMYASTWLSIMCPCRVRCGAVCPCALRCGVCPCVRVSCHVQCCVCRVCVRVCVVWCGVMLHVVR